MLSSTAKAPRIATSTQVFLKVARLHVHGQEQARVVTTSDLSQASQRLEEELFDKLTNVLIKLICSRQTFSDKSWVELMEYHHVNTNSECFNFDARAPIRYSRQAEAAISMLLNPQKFDRSKLRYTYTDVPDGVKRMS